MLSFFEWLAARPALARRPWLILGKGPSFARRGDADLSDYALLSLNHVAREQPVTAAHLIDLDVVADCGDALLSNAAVVVMPWHPHVDHRPAAESLPVLARRDPVLRVLAREGRLVGYDSSLAPERHGPGPVVRVRYFSAEAALHLLALAGVGRIRSLGVDGGTAYASRFRDLSERTRLANGQPSFDLQFREFPRILRETGVDFAPLGEPCPMRVFVGATPSEWLPARVLHWSLARHATRSLVVTPIHETGVSLPLPRDPANRPRTPFSLQRFAVPEAAGRRGRALYLDSDMLALADVAELWTQPFGGADCLSVERQPGTAAGVEHSVLLMDCESLDWSVPRIVADLDAGRSEYSALLARLTPATRAAARLPARWNHVDRHAPDETALIHYSDMTRQPWVAAGHPHAGPWLEALGEALAAGFVSPAEIEREVRLGHVRPSLCDVLSGREPPQRSDRGFVPPYASLAAAAQPGGA